MTLAPAPSVAVASAVYGDAPAHDDPAEAFHEASRLYPATALAQLPGLQPLHDDPALAASVERAARRHRHRPGVSLARPRRLRARLDTALAQRRSGLPPPTRRLSLRATSALLAAAYGVQSDRGARRVPSAGALYPLELYPIALRIEGIPAAVSHYDPFDHRLARLDDGDDVEPRLRTALVDPAPLDAAACAVAITAVFWRTRFKYGQRGYRFALLEAGHVAQNLLLAAAALGLPALPLGGFYDVRLDALLGVDGVDESSLYLVLVGGGR